jgi:hypothetical protein
MDAPVATAGEIAEQLPIGRRGVHGRLSHLYLHGNVERKKVGPRVVWWALEGISDPADPEEVAGWGEAQNLVLSGPTLTGDTGDTRGVLAAWVHGAYGDGETFDDWPGNNPETAGIVTKGDPILNYEYDPYERVLTGEDGTEYEDVVAKAIDETSRVRGR